MTPEPGPERRVGTRLAAVGLALAALLALPGLRASAASRRPPLLPLSTLRSLRRSEKPQELGHATTAPAPRVMPPDT
jgi:hypothetical protein